MSTAAAFVPTPVASFLARRPVWQVCYLTGLAAGVAAEVWGLAARAAGVPMRAAGPGSHHASAITAGMFAMGAMVVTFWFTFAVVLIARRARNPARTYLRTVLPLLALSFATPLTAADTPVPTKLTLCAAHLVAAAVVVPAVAGRLARVPGRDSA